MKTFSCIALFAVSSNLWEELSDAAGLVIAALFVASGALVGYVLRWLVGRWQSESAEKSAMMNAEAVKAEAESIKREAEIAAKAVSVKALEDFEKSVAARRAEQEQVEARLTARAESLDRKSSLLDSREAVLKAKAAEAEKTMSAALQKLSEAEKMMQNAAGMTRLQARTEIFAQTNAALKADAESLSRRIQEAARERGEDAARAIIADAIGRCAVKQASGMSISAVSVPNPEMKGRIVGKDGRNVRAFEAATGTTIILDDAPDAVVISAFDPVRREIARRALVSLVADGRIHLSSIEDAVKAAEEEVASTKRKEAEAAAAEAGVSGLDSATLDLAGSLAYRTSFSQNVLRHSVEVALLTGAMAGEMGLDAAKGRRIGFLHDIGKAITSTSRGSHAVLGAEFLKAQGEPEDVCRAVASHHGETGIDGGIYGALCAAADAISSSRPGARLERIGDYMRRLEEFERLAKNHEGVINAMAVHAGRDLRVFVDSGKVSDAEAGEIARRICREISVAQKFPGQIRVTVIRETRCVEYAK